MAALNNLKITGGQLIPKLISRIEARICTTANVAENHPVPSGARFARLSASAVSYIKGDGAAAVPAADETAGAAAYKLDANVEKYFDVTGVANISCVSATAGAVISIAFYGAVD